MLKRFPHFHLQKSLQFSNCLCILFCCCIQSTTILSASISCQPESLCERCKFFKSPIHFSRINVSYVLGQHSEDPRLIASQYAFLWQYNTVIEFEFVLQVLHELESDSLADPFSVFLHSPTQWIILEQSKFFT